MKKVAIVTPTLPPYAGGIGNVAAAHARQLKNLGYEVTIFTPAYDKQVTEEVTEVKIQRVPPLFKFGNAAYVPALSWMLRGFDIIHIHYPFFGGIEPIWLHHRKFKKQFGTKIILHYHMDAFGTGVKQLIFKIHKLLLFKAFVKMSDLVMVTSRDYAQHAAIGPYLTRWPEKFVEVPNGVDVLHFQPARRDPGISQAYNILPSEKVVAFVGGLDKAHYFKGIEHLLASMASLRTAPYTWKVLIVGDGDLRSNYESLATQLNIAQRVIFTGYVPNDKLPAHYNLADVVVLPSVDQSEAFGMALAEGMACGKPGIASDLPGVRTVVEHQYTGLIVPPRDEKGLANTINHLLLHPELAAEYGRNGHRKAQRRYSWKQIGLQLNQLYQRLWVDV